MIGEPTKPQWGAVLAEGTQVLDANAVVAFTPYVRVVLPLDGFVFWVRADLLSLSALSAANAAPNTTAINKAAPDQVPPTPAPPTPFTAQGSLHVAATHTQDPDESYVSNAVVFTSLVPIPYFNSTTPGLMYLGSYDVEGHTIRFSFSSRANFYRQADLYHYAGDAVYSTMLTQIIDSPDQLDLRDVVVSNSLPYWLTFNTVCPVFPSYLVPDNQPPPYVAVDISPDSTDYLQPIPWIDGTGSHWQLCKDTVRFSIYGLRNFGAMDFLDSVMAAIGYDGDPVGLMTGPVVRDQKVWQVELGVLAQKKEISIDASYYQSRMRAIAQQYILSCIPNYIIQGLS